MSVLMEVEWNAWRCPLCNELMGDGEPDVSQMWCSGTTMGTYDEVISHDQQHKAARCWRLTVEQVRVTAFGQEREQ